MASADSAGRRAPQNARRIEGVLASRGLALFSETIVVSLAVAVLSIPAVTTLPAFAAGSAHLRRHVAGESDALGALAKDFLLAVRRGWLWGALSAGCFTAIAITVTSPTALDIPGGAYYRWISGLLGVCCAVVLLRAAAIWERSASWSALIRAAARRSLSDISGSLLLVLALGLSALIVWMFAPMVVLVPGMLVLAGHAVTVRSQ